MQEEHTQTTQDPRPQDPRMQDPRPRIVTGAVDIPLLSSYVRHPLAQVVNGLVIEQAGVRLLLGEVIAVPDNYTVLQAVELLTADYKALKQQIARIRGEA